MYDLHIHMQSVTVTIIFECDSLLYNIYQLWNFYEVNMLYTDLLGLD
jgi:hypothetical protein